MCLANINCQEIRVLLVIIVDLNYVTNLATERWSSEAAEHQHERSSSSPLSNVKPGCSVERHQTSIWRLISYFQIAPVHVR